MNCRKVSSLLSAYMDAELTGGEMLAIRAHLSECAVCNREHEELRETKNLLARLGSYTPRADLETLLLGQAETSAKPFARYAPTWLVMRLGAGVSLPAAVAPVLLRPRPLAATALLSLAGFVVATVKLEPSGDVSPSGGSDMVAVTPGVSGIPSPAAPDLVYTPSPVALPVADATPLTWSRAADGESALLLSGRNVSSPPRVMGASRTTNAGFGSVGRVSILPASFAASLR